MAIARQDAAPTLPSLMERMKPQIQKALPKHVNTERFARIALTQFRKTPELQGCLATTDGQASLLGALMQAAQLGLEPGTLGQCYILPFRNQGRQEAQFILGYRGMIDLARRSNSIVSIYANMVYENDDFEFSFGVNGTLDHRPALKNRGEAIGVYAFAQLTKGGYQYVFLTLEEVDKIKDSSKSSGSKYSPWNNWYGEMAKKTAIRRLFKMLPVSVEYLTHGDENILRLQDGEIVEVDVYEDEPEAYTPDQLNERFESADVETEPEQASIDVDPKTDDPTANTKDATSLRRSIGALMGQCSDLTDEDKDALRSRCADMGVPELEEIRAGLEKASTDIKSDGQVSERAEVVYMLGRQT